MIQLDKSLTDALNEGMKTTNGTELPFPAPVIYVVNGDAKLKQIGGAQYFGGWASDAVKLLEAGNSWGQTDAPRGFERVEMTAKNGTALDVFTARSVIVAPIDLRKSWFMQDENGTAKRSAEYFAGARQQVQVLCYLAHKVEDKYQPWAACVLSAKGMQAKNLIQSFTEWQRKIATVKAKIAPTVPAWCFYLAVGTFGKERKAETVGKGNSTSAITPVEAYIPETVDAGLLEKLFVGAEVAEAMATCKAQAADWLKAWNQKPAAGNGGPAEPDFPLDPMMNGVEPSDDIPF